MAAAPQSLDQLLAELRRQAAKIKEGGGKTADGGQEPGAEGKANSAVHGWSLPKAQAVFVLG